jgi:hypothetical protein
MPKIQSNPSSLLHATAELAPSGPVEPLTAAAAISVDLENDKLVRVDQLPNLLPCGKRGKRVAISAVYRWMQRGGLPFLRIGGSRYTSLRAVQAWAQLRTTGNSTMKVAAPPAVPATRSNTESVIALDRELDAQGL